MKANKKSTKIKGNISGARCYLAGPMEFADGRSWRIDICENLSALGVVCLNPYEDFFESGKISEEGLHDKVTELRLNKEYELLESISSNIRYYDLAAVAKSDFIIAYINTDTFCFGTIEEIVRACELEKPVYVMVEQGKQGAPFWLFGLVGEQCIFDSPDQILDDLRNIDSDKSKASLEEWAILAEDIR